MEKKTSLIKRSLIAGSLLAATGFNAQASQPFHHHSWGTGEEIRACLLGGQSSARNLDLACGEKKDTATAGKGKEGKCGEGKCGEKKMDKKKNKSKKGKEGKCGEGKCGESKKKG